MLTQYQQEIFSQPKEKVLSTPSPQICKFIAKINKFCKLFDLIMEVVLLENILIHQKYYKSAYKIQIN